MRNKPLFGAASALVLCAVVCPAMLPAQTPAVSSLQQGLDALHAGHAQQALDLFKQAIAADPQSSPANLLAATAAIQLLQAAAAVSYAERARALEPNNWKIDTTLVTAYAMAGDTRKRDAERYLLSQAHGDAKLPDARETSGFLLDRFQAGKYVVDAVQYFKPIGTFNMYYRFLVHNAAGALVWTIQVDSDSLNEVSWAQSYPTQAAQGERQFQIESSPADNQVQYKSFSGQPNYDWIRTQVIKILDAQKDPFPGEMPTQ
jgi:tetratricopeptide (TPR) repeat protein